ncbi:hypothetical protein FOA52_013619 [Chlamydomonas sp. UWO 241]|nr:hypothetical protein FOA52_013619 [Chlamydomonas sp. UWO 241]
MHVVPATVASFGAPSSEPVAWQPVLHPLGPWSAISVAAPSGNAGPADTSAGQQQRGPGVLLFFTVPQSCVDRVKENALLKALVPGAAWL